MSITKKVLLGSAALATLGFASDVRAFDEVNWVWNKEVSNLETISIEVDDFIDISGLVEIEKLQMNIGDVTAEAYLSDFDNNVPGGVEGIVTASIDDTLTIGFDYTDDDGDIENNPVDVNSTLVESDSGLVSGDVTGGNVDEQFNNVTQVTVDLSGEVEVDLANVDFTDVVQDAVDLPKVENLATAVANNQSISSTVAINLHDGQFNFGGFADESSSQVDPEIVGFGTDITGNTHTNLAISAALAGAAGIITPSEVTATAIVNDEIPLDLEFVDGDDDVSVLNASVENVATAVANNFSVDVDANIEGDAFMIADVTQFNYGDVSALADVDDVQINNYAGLGAAGFGNLAEVQTPIISNVATAVGNNFSVTVNSPVVDTP